MLQPGSKGWINKFFYLEEKKEINTSFTRPKGVNEEHFIHLFLGQSGINFGYPSKLLFATKIETSSWTSEERLKFLLFESHYFVYQYYTKKTKQSKEDFIHSMLEFYGKHNSYSITKIFTFFLKESNEEKLEDILAKRVDIKVKLLDNRIWINSLSNVFVYLDVILYHDFLKSKNQQTFSNYNELAQNALIAISMAASSDGFIQDSEKAMFKIFLASANLPDKNKNFVQTKFKKGAATSDFTPIVMSNWMFKQFILDLAILTIYSKNQTELKEKTYLTELCDFLEISVQSLNESILLVEKFVVENHEKVSFLQSSSSYEKIYSNLSRHWLKILGRNKDKIGVELKQSKELIFLIKKSATEDLTKEEKEVVKTQFMDIIKSMPSLAIFMLPGGALLLPLILKVIPDLIPSAFRDNEIDEA
ncbi:MAG: hypothetical protein HYR91_10160 [Flavobacteriia bacterium]|nr:hypothetical protein [Flavobacteriia bacterium]